MLACLLACLLSPLLHSLMVRPTMGGSSLVSHQLCHSPRGTVWWFERECPTSAHVGILDSRLVELLGKDSEVWLWSVGGVTFKVLKGLRHSECGCISECELSATAPAPRPPACSHGACHEGRGLWSCEPQALSSLSCLGHGVLLQQQEST